MSDGDAVVAWIEPSLTGLTKERADDRSGTSACGPDKEQRVYTAKGNFANPSKESPVNLLGILKTELLGRGYHTEVVNNLDLSEDDTSVVVVINPDVRLTFVLFARLDATPNLVIVGKTECYSRAG